MSLENSEQLSYEDLKKQNAQLQQAIKNHKQAFEAVNDDFITYQQETDTVIGELEKSLKKQQNMSSLLNVTLQTREKALNQSTADIRVLKSQLSTQQSQLQNMSHVYESQLKLSQMNYQDQVQQTIECNRSGNQSEITYLKLAYNTQLNEIQKLQFELKQEKSITESLFKQINELRLQQNEDIPVNEQSELARLRTILYKSQVMIAALGCPFDISSEEVCEKLIEAKNSDNFAAMTDSQFLRSDLDTQIDTLLNKGLYLMGMRVQKQYFDPSNRPWRNQQYEGESNQTYESFKSLIRKNSELSAQNTILASEIEQLSKQAQIHKQRIDILTRENEKLVQLQQTELKTHAKCNDSLIKQIQYWSGIGQKYNIQLSQMHQQTIQEVSTVKMMNQNYSDILAKLDGLKELNCKIDDVTDASQSYKLIDTLNELIEQLQTTKINPQLFSVCEIVQKQYGLPVPPNVLRYFDEKLEQIAQELLERSKINKNALNLLISSVLKQQPKNGDFSNFSKKLELLVKESNVIFEEVIEQDLNSQIIDELKSKIAELESNTKTLQKERDELLEKQHVQLVIQKTENGEIVFSTEDAGIVDKMLSCQSQNRSGRYISYLEIMSKELVQYFSECQKPINQLTNQLAQITQGQLMQHDSFNNLNQSLLNNCNRIQLKLNQQLQQIQQKSDFCERLNVLKNATTQIINSAPRFQNLITEFEAFFAKFQAKSEPVFMQTEVKSDLTEINSLQSQFLQLNTQLTQYQQYLAEDREKIRLFIDETRGTEQAKNKKLRECYTQSELRLQKAEQEAAQIRKTYTQLSVNKFEDVQKYNSEIKKLQNENNDLKVEIVKKIRDTREEMLRMFREKETIYEKQIKMLSTHDLEIK
ncbi:Conserved_hypothetical protein [Hexamita inflata]|uniref:Uncharacterized protein n=1 Tax=Hexamita inflata TaxID=28002 RepID=A0AA86N864_9EUKA|nr:Conserved hypothetical protein [Hexamita inflata]